MRAFAFLVGRMKNPDEKALKEMACNNRGYFYKIETLGNVWDTVLKYLSVLSRPMARIDSEVKPVYTPVYMDSTGIGMVMTASVGVFSKKKKEVMGVAGTDIALTTLEEIIPRSKLGVFSHAFVINNNGFIVLHPKFRNQSGHLPAPPNVYLEDVEYSVNVNESIQLKRVMIDREVNTTSFAIYWLYENGRKLFQTSATYFYGVINNTEFSSAIAVVDTDLNYYDLEYTTENDRWKPDGIKALSVPNVTNKDENYTASNFTYVQICPWTYCSDVIAQAQSEQPKSIKMYPTAAEIYEKYKVNFTNCDQRLIYNLLVTAGIVDKNVQETWLPQHIRKDNIESVFVATNGGYSKYFTFNNESKPFNRDVFKSEVFQPAAAAPTKTKIILSASANKKPTVTVTAAVRTGPSKVLSAGTYVQLFL